MMRQTFVDAPDHLAVRLLAVHERAAAAAVHDLRPAVANHLREAVVAVHDRKLNDLRVGQQEVASCTNKKCYTYIFLAFHRHIKI